MADVNLPNFSELGQMEFMSPMAFQQANKQIDLANLFQQQNLQSGAEDLRTKSLANQFSEQANPLRVNKMGIENAGLTSENILKDIDAKQRAELAPEELQAKRQKMLADMDENKLKQFMSRAEWEMNQDDPKLQASGLKKIMASKAEFDRRNKQQDELGKIAAQGDNAKAVANIHAGATLGAARIGADSRREAAAAKSKGLMDFDQAVAMGKITPDKALVYATVKAQNSSDPEEQAAWVAKARTFETIVQNKAAAVKQGTPDVGAMANVPTLQPQSAFAGAPTVPPRPAAVPQGAVEMLKKNPALRQKFDEKYGAGASKNILGN